MPPKKATNDPCNFCVAPVTRIVNGEEYEGTCKRLASCVAGCKNFCWQHAKEYSKKQAKRQGKRYRSPGKGKCKQPEIKGCDKRPRYYPCTISRTTIFNEEEFQRCDKECTGAGGPTEKEVGKATKEWRNLSTSPVKKARTKHKVRFASP